MTFKVTNSNSVITAFFAFSKAILAKFELSSPGMAQRPEFHFSLVSPYSYLRVKNVLKWYQQRKRVNLKLLKALDYKNRKRNQLPFLAMWLGVPSTMGYSP